MALSVRVEIDSETESAFAVFSNEHVEFSLDGIPITDYFEAATACINGNNWEGDLMKVEDGKVTVSISSVGSYQGGYMVCTLKAEHCFDAFMQAFNELSAVYF